MRQYGITRCDLPGIPAGARVEIVALALVGDTRTLVAYEGRTARLPNEAVIELLP